MDKFLETNNLPKLNQEETERMNRLITTSEIEVVIKKLLAQKSPGPGGFLDEFYKTFKELTPILLNYSKKFKKKEDSQTLFMKPVFS